MENAIFKRAGKPFFPVGGQAHNSSAYQADGLNKALAALRAMGGNTLTVPVYWNQVEPEEGSFDFSGLVNIVRRVQSEGFALILNWFGTWKNGGANYVPDWVKLDPLRFRRVTDFGGVSLNVLSSHCEANVQADARAFAVLGSALRAMDSQGNTLIGVQVENEPGIYPGAMRDFGIEAEAEWTSPLPEELCDFLTAQTDTSTALLWRRHGSRTENWALAFGADAAEFFTAWSVSGYVERVAAAGAAAYETTLLSNAWVQQKGWRVAGLDYPAGGPVAKTLDLWKWRTPHIRLIGPDAYLQTEKEYHECLSAYARTDNPLFIPEAGKEEWHSRFMAEAVGTHRACGYMCFGLEGALDAQGRLTDSCAAAAGTMRAMEATAGALLHHAAWPLVTINQAEYAEAQFMEWDEYLAVAYFLNNQTNHDEGDWNWHDHEHADCRERLRRTGARGRGWVMQAAPHEFIIAGDGFRVQFFPKRALGPQLSPLLSREGLIGRACAYLTVEEGRFTMEGDYEPRKARNGDESDFGVWVEPDCGAVRARLTP